MLLRSEKFKGMDCDPFSWLRVLLLFFGGEYGDGRWNFFGLGISPVTYKTLQFLTLKEFHSTLLSLWKNQQT